MAQGLREVESENQTLLYQECSGAAKYVVYIANAFGGLKHVLEKNTFVAL